MKLCPIQEICIDYNSGSNKPPNHDVRISEPCKLWLDMSCELVSLFYMKIKGSYPACNIEKIRRLKK